MAYIAKVANDMGRECREDKPTCGFVARVFSMAKLPPALLHSGNLNQCVIDEAFSICILAMVDRIQADCVLGEVVASSPRNHRHENRVGKCGLSFRIPPT